MHVIYNSVFLISEHAILGTLHGDGLNKLSRTAAFL